MKLEKIIIDSKIDLFNSKIVGIVGSAATGKSSLMRHLYNFYDGLRFAMLYENKETLECLHKDILSLNFQIEKYSYMMDFVTTETIIVLYA